MNSIIDDEQFAALFKEPIASDYKNALLLINDAIYDKKLSKEIVFCKTLG